MLLSCHLFVRSVSGKRKGNGSGIPQGTPLLGADRYACLFVELFMHLVKSLICDVRVDLRGGNGGVAEHFLDGADVGAVNEEFCGKGVAENMRRDAFDNAGVKGSCADDVFDRDGREAMFFGKCNVVN